MRGFRRKPDLCAKDCKYTKGFWAICTWIICLILLLFLRNVILEKDVPTNLERNSVITLSDIEAALEKHNVSNADEGNSSDLSDEILRDYSTIENIRVVIKTTGFEKLYHREVLLSSNQKFVLLVENEDGLNEYQCQAEDCIQLDEMSDFTKIQIMTNEENGKISLPSITRNQGVPSYSGLLEILNTNQGMIIINELPIEDYLLSVVPSEMPASYSEEALKAQAICARTYAYQSVISMGYPEWNAHVDDSTGYQVYNNINEQIRSSNAVLQTKGQVLLKEDGSLANVYYYSTSCGLGSDTRVWGRENNEEFDYMKPQYISELGLQYALSNSTHIGPIEVSEEDFRDYICSVNYDDFEYNEPWYRWNMEVEKMDFNRLYQNLSDNYQSNPNLVLTKNKNGVYESAPIKKFDIIYDICVDRRIGGGAISELVIETNGGNYKVLTGNAIRRVLCNPKIEIYKQDGSCTTMPTLLPSAFFVIDTMKVDGELIGYCLTGGGYGHGVGMSQNAANRIAKCGFIAEEILRFFFVNCEIVNVRV